MAAEEGGEIGEGGEEGDGEEDAAELGVAGGVFGGEEGDEVFLFWGC